MKSKRVLTILLSMAIMLSFMPAMAFAAAPATSATQPHKWVKDASKSIEPTCQHDGLYVYSCEGEDLGTTAAGDKMALECEATWAEYVVSDKACTPKANPIQLSKADYLVRLVADRGYTEDQIKEIAESNTKCYVFAYECKDCGKIIPAADSDWQNHKAPDDTASCAISYECVFCGQTVYTGKHSASEYVDDPRAFINALRAHNYDRKLVGENFCSDGTDESAGYDVYEFKCRDCGDTFNWFVSSNGGYGQPTHVKHESLSKVEYKKADCTHTGEYAEKCDVCGAYVFHRKSNGQPEDAWVIPEKGHDYETVNFPATCTDRGYTKGICKVCGATQHKAYTDDALGHDYKVEVVFEPNCDCAGITMIYCTRCKAANDFAENAYRRAQTIVNVDKDGYVINAPTKDSKLYYVGLRSSSYPYRQEFIDSHNRITSGAIEVADWAQKTHNWGQYETLREADCEHGGYNAKKCSVCGHYDVHTAKQVGDAVGHQWITVTQEPTCGSKGFTYDVCKVCKEPKTEKVQYFGQPVVAYGVECDFSEWIVETPATPFKEGTKKLVCSVCGDDGHIVAVRDQAKEMGVTRASIAKTKIAAPKVKAGKKKATVTVKAVEGAVKYQIKVNGKVKKTVTKAGKVTIKKLKGGKKAKFQIVAINDKGVKAASKVKTVKIKK